MPYDNLVLSNAFVLLTYTIIIYNLPFYMYNLSFFCLHIYLSLFQPKYALNFHQSANCPGIKFFFLVLILLTKFDPNSTIKRRSFGAIFKIMMLITYKYNANLSKMIQKKCIFSSEKWCK